MSKPIAVHAVLLAAGASRRFGADNKLLADLDGAPLVSVAAKNLLATDLSAIVAVVASGSDGASVAAALAGLPMEIVVNADADRGMGSSIACGVAAVPKDVGIMIVPADMPMLDECLINELVAAFRNADGQMIVHPVSRTGSQRNPVIWPARLRSELLSIDPHTGGKALLSAHRNDVRTISTSDDGAFKDIDTPDDLARVLAGRR